MISIESLKMKTMPIKDLFASADQLLGRTPDDTELRTLLQSLGMWPLPAFGPEELSIYLEDRARGFCLEFRDSSSVRHPVAAGKPAQTPIFEGVFFYAEGVDGYRAYVGTFPYGITWSDTAASLPSKVGPPKHEIKNKKTGLLSSHRWSAGRWNLTARYRGGGVSIKHLHLGII